MNKHSQNGEIEDKNESIDLEALLNQDALPELVEPNLE